VSTAVERTLRSKFGSSHVIRMAGADRYECSKNFAVWASGLGSWGVPGLFVGTPGTPAALFALDPRYLGVATGENFPDALLGGAFAGTAGAPLILSPRAVLSPWIAGKGSAGWLAAVHRSGLPTPVIQRTYVFGPAASVTDAVLVALDRATGR
jgi:hypothetical protein